MTSRWSLRPTADADRAFLRRLYGSTRTNELTAVDWDESVKSAFLDQQFHAQDSYYREQFPQCEFSVVVVDEEDAGRLYVDRREDEIRIVDLALLPKWRGQGLGGEIMASVISEAEAAGLPVRIHVEEYNPAQRLYARLGFRPLQRAGTYILLERRPG